MILNNSKDFDRYILENDILNDDLFDVENENLKITKFKSVNVEFHNCTFNCKSLLISNIIQQDLSVEFDNCTFNCDLSFYNCKIGRLKFSNTKTIRSLKINGDYLDFEKKCEINSFWFNNIKEDKKDNDKFERNDEIILSTYFSFRNVFFKQNFEFNNINNIKGIFSFSNNIIGDELYKNKSSCVFHSSKLSNVHFSDNVFNTYTSFTNSKFYFDNDNFKNTGANWKASKFERNQFNKVKFNDVEFTGYFEFNNCDFLSTTWFENCKNLENSKLKFVACKFEKYSLFDNSKLNRIEILHSKFQEKSSFENLETNYFKIHQVTFGGAAYFDDLNKNNNVVIENWDRKTLRAIKRELINTQNQIDYLRFKAYELNAYDKEKGKNFKDRIVLFFNRHSNYFGLDWTKGLLFILTSSFIFYLLYLISYAIAMRHTFYFPNTVEDFLVTYLKFLNPFTFLKSPIDDAEKYFFPYLSFIFGKIFISYGIYQTIQAFRKFGVTGG